MTKPFRLALALASLLCVSTAYAQSTKEAPAGSGQRYQGTILIDPTTGQGYAATGGSGGGGSAADQTATNGTDGQATSTANQHSVVFNYGFNGATWDRARLGAGGAWLTIINAPLPAGTNAIGSITNTAFGISGTLPPFASVPAFKIDQTTPGTTNKVSIGTDGSVAVNNFPATQVVSGAVTANQGAAGASAWKVDGSGVTQPVSGTVAATEADGANAALGSKADAAAGTGTVSAIAIFKQLHLDLLASTPASVTTAAPSYTTGTTQPLSMTTAGGLRVDGSGTTQPVSGTVTANQGGAPWAVNTTQLAGSALGAPTAYGTAPTGNVAGVNANVTNFPATQPISAAALPLPAGAATSANQTATTGPAAPGTSATSSALAGLQYNSTPPTVASGQQVAQQADVNGNTKVSVANTPTVNLNPQGAGNTIGSFALNATSFANGLSSASRIPSSAASTNLTLAKTGATRVYKIVGYNTGSTPVRIKFYNAASTGAVTVGTTTIAFSRVFMPGYSSFDFADVGFSLSSGAVYALVTGSADSDATAPAAAAITDLSVEYQ